MVYQSFSIKDHSDEVLLVSIRSITTLNTVSIVKQMLIRFQTFPDDHNRIQWKYFLFSFHAMSREDITPNDYYQQEN